MEEKLLQRLRTLRHEYQLGEKALDDLEAKQLNLKETLLRISGAIQVLEELLAEPDQSGAAETSTAQESNQSDELVSDELP